jgi:hypothetical protein
MSQKLNSSIAVVGIEHKISASPPKPDVCALMSTRPNITVVSFLLAHLFDV